MDEALNALLDSLIERRETEVQALSTQLAVVENELRQLRSQRLIPEPQSKLDQVRGLVTTHGAVTAAQAGRTLHMSAATATKYLNMLLDIGIVEKRQGRAGRIRFVYRGAVEDKTIASGSVTSIRANGTLPVPKTGRVAIADKELRRVIELAVRHGCIYERPGRGGHGRLLDKDGNVITTLPSTPRDSDHAAAHVRRALKQRGIAA